MTFSGYIRFNLNCFIATFYLIQVSTMSIVFILNERKPEERKHLNISVIPSNKKVSQYVSRYLDGLGYSRTQIWNRIRNMNIHSKVSDLSIKCSIKTNNERFFIGSQREGLGLPVLSDLDVMQVDQNVICSKDASFVDDKRFVLKTIDTNTPPGYCRLQVDKSNVDSKLFQFEKYKYATVERSGQTYLSSKLFVTKLEDDMLKVSKFTKINSLFQPQHGPSIPRCVQYTTASSLFSKLQATAFSSMNEQSDFVRAFLFDGKAILNVWQTRPRKYNWPSRNLIRNIMTLPIYVVPVGHTGSINEDLEWRISFIWVEIKLIQSFNNVQMKIFLLLKLVAKHYFNSESQILSSYVIKNIMFWLAEDIPRKKFRQKHLIARVMDALKMLHNYVMTKSLPNYMQPDRNLFTNKINDAEQQHLIQKIELIQCKGLVYLGDILYKVQPSTNCVIQEVISELRQHSEMSKREIDAFKECNIFERLHISIVEHKLKSYPQQVMATAFMLNGKCAVNGVTSLTTDKYCSDKLIDVEKGLKTCNGNMKPGSMKMLQLVCFTYMIRSLAFFIWLFSSCVLKVWYLSDKIQQLIRHNQPVDAWVNRRHYNAEELTLLIGMVYWGHKRSECIFMMLMTISLPIIAVHFFVNALLKVIS
ncbi:hypothetical protein ACF0H5_017658 [Mactra antiquata]